MKKRIAVCVVFMVMVCISFAWGDGGNEIKSFDFYGLEEVVRENTHMSFEGLVEDIVKGKGVWNTLKERMLNILKEEILYNNGYVKNIIAAALISGLINIFAGDIRDKSVGELVSFTGQAVILGIAAAAFKNSILQLKNCISSVTDIINSALPFMIMLLSASGKGSVIAGGGVFAIGTSLTGSFVNAVVIPMLTLSTLIRIINIISKKQILDKMSELFTKMTSLGLKGCAYVFVFLITIERLSGGIVNKSIGKTVKSVFKMIPVIGDVIGGVSDITISTLSAVSSGVGIVLMIVIVFTAIVPVIKIAVVCLIFKGTAAVIEPVCDKETVNIIDAVGESSFMILSAVFIINAMFAVSCAILLCGVS